MCEIYGYWSEELFVKDCTTGESESIYKFPAAIPDADRQFGFDQFALTMNFIPPEL